jgi:hypothetical protein
VQYARNKEEEKKREGREAEKKSQTEHRMSEKKELIQKKKEKTNYFRMLDSIARVLTNYHHTNKRTF